MPTTNVHFNGKLFTAPEQAFRKGKTAGLSSAGTQIEATIKLKTPKRTGAFAAGIKREVWSNANGVSIAAKYPKKIRTWLETGKRRGVKTKRKGAYMFKAGKAKAKSLDYQRIIGNEIAKALND